jgi:hypothetical protein
MMGSSPLAMIRAMRLNETPIQQRSLKFDERARAFQDS